MALIRLLKVTLKQAQVLTMTLREDPGWEGILFPELCSFLAGDWEDGRQLEGRDDFRDLYSLLFECPHQEITRKEQRRELALGDLHRA